VLSVVTVTDAPASLFRTKPVAVDLTYEPLIAIVPLGAVMPALLCLTLDATMVDGVAPLVPSTSTLSST
jgi:hypothetical protein